MPTTITAAWAHLLILCCGMQSGIVTKIKAQGAIARLLLGLAFRYKTWRIRCGASASQVRPPLWPRLRDMPWSAHGKQLQGVR